jgi:phthalate 4,5-cis-dihydrodiol dehydrogenase
MIRAGIIGAGGISDSYMSAAEKLSDFQITCMADIVTEKIERFVEKYGINSYKDYEEMIDSENLDAVIIALPHGLHKDIVIHCCKRKLHVLVEKPMAVSTEECEEMIEAAKENNIKLMVGHIQRYFSENIKAKEIIQSGELGKLTMIVDIRNNNYFISDRPGWFFNPKMSGGGIFMNYGAHSLDKIMWLTNSKVKNITGRIGYYAERMSVEGNAQAMVELESGITAVISQCGYKGEIRNETCIYMTNGTIKLCTGKGLYINKGSGYEEVLVSKEGSPFERQLVSFLKAIKENKEPEITGQYGRDIIAAIEELYCCSSTNEKLD